MTLKIRPLILLLALHLTGGTISIYGQLGMTLLTLFVAPMVYSWLARVHRRA